MTSVSVIGQPSAETPKPNQNQSKPSCPKCKLTAIVKISRSVKNPNRPFFSCPANPSCDIWVGWADGFSSNAKQGPVGDRKRKRNNNIGTPGMSLATIKQNEKEQLSREKKSAAMRNAGLEGSRGDFVKFSKLGGYSTGKRVRFRLVLLY